MPSVKGTVEYKKLTAAQMDKVVFMVQRQLENPEAPLELPPRAKPGPKPKPKPEAPAKEAGKKRAAGASEAPAAKKPKKAAEPKPKAAPKAAASPKAAPKAQAPKAKPGPKPSPKPAPKPSPASSKKKAPKPKEEEVRMVERIVGIRANKAGDTEFLIKWTGLNSRENTWEPESHILDDTLIDEYMKSKLVKMAPGGKYAVGAKVEVLGDADGFEYSWAPAKVTKVTKAGRYDVEFEDFMDGKKKLTESSIELGRLRPTQSKKAPVKWKPGLGELIEVFEDDCWWEAKALGTATAKKKEMVKVMLRVSDETKSYPLEHARPSCWWGKKG